MRFVALALALGVAGCMVESARINGPDPNGLYYSVSCKGLGLDLGDCWNEASRICQRRPWRIMDHVDRSGAVVFASANSAVVSRAEAHQLIVQCGPVPVATTSSAPVAAPPVATQSPPPPPAASGPSPTTKEPYPVQDPWR